MAALRARLLGFAFLLGSLAPALAAGAELTATPQQAADIAASMLLRGDLGNARQLLVALHRAAPADPQVRFLLAELAMAENRLADAIALYRSLLGEDGNRLRVRLELARALFRNHDYDAARFHFELALGEPLPAAARERIRGYLTAIRGQTTRFSLSVLVTPDSNPTRASTESTVRVLGQTFTLNPDARAQGGTGVHVQGEGRVAFGSGDRSFFRAAFEHREFHGDYADYSYLQATAGRSWFSGAHVWTAEAGPVGALFRGDALYSGAVVQGTHASPYGDRLQVMQSVNVRRLDYVRASDALDADQGWAGVQVQWLIDGRSNLTAGLSTGFNDARTRDNGWRAWSASLVWNREFRSGFNAQARYLESRFDYLAMHPLFGEWRRERTREFAVDLTARNLSLAGFAPRVTLGYTRNDSNLELYRHDRRLVGAGVTRDF